MVEIPITIYKKIFLLMENDFNIDTNHTGVNLIILSITTFGAIISHVTASGMAAFFTILLAIVGLVNYYYNIKKTKMEIKKLENEKK